MAEIEVVLQGMSTATSQGSLSYCSVTLIRGEHLTLVDVAYQARRELLVQALAARGITPDQIDRVVLTHAHWDHSLNLLQFPNAEVMLHQDEHEYCQSPKAGDLATPVWISDILRRCRTVTTLRDGDEIEPGVRVMAAPGHSPGSMAVLVESARGVLGVVGDALPNRASAMAPVPTARLVFFDEEAAERSARRLLDTCVEMYPGHDRPFAVQSGQFRYLDQQTITLLNPPRDDDGTIHASIDETVAPFTPLIQPTARRKA